MRWIKISIFNFTLLALLGCILRYKIAFSLPYIDQKHLLHAHSHFAFAGWVSQILMSILLFSLCNDKLEWESKIKKFEKIFFMNLIAAYGMLISFALQGYAPFSIIFSTASILVSYWFVITVFPIIKECNIHVITKKYFYAALIFNVLSSLGPFSLAFMMAGNSANQDYLLGAVFYYLHFQYNGWFLFVIFGTLNEQIAKKTVNFEFKRNFNALAAAAVLTLFLSIPWIDKQNMLGILLFAIVIIQLFVFIAFLRNTEEGNGPPLVLSSKIKMPLKRIVAFALIIKGVLQIIILVPYIDQYAFGLRPVIIAYLHLVLIGIVSFFIFHFLLKEKILFMSKNLNQGLLIFLGGFILNEIVLVLQGLSWLNIVGLPLTNESLFIAAIFMLSGLIVVTISILNGPAMEKEKFRDSPYFE